MDWKKVLGGLAPTIATAIGGPFAGLATRFVSNALLGKPDGNDEEINAYLDANPDKIIDLKIAETEMKAELAKHGVDLEKVHAADRDSARYRQVSLKDRTPDILVYLITLLYAGGIAALLFIDVKTEAKDMLNIMFGSLTTVWIMAIKYYFGSSASSKRKDNLINHG